MAMALPLVALWHTSGTKNTAWDPIMPCPRKGSKPRTPYLGSAVFLGEEEANWTSSEIRLWCLPAMNIQAVQRKTCSVVSQYQPDSPSRYFILLCRLPRCTRLLPHSPSSTRSCNHHDPRHWSSKDVPYSTESFSRSRYTRIHQSRAASQTWI